MIGAGLSGSAVAHSLASRGWAVTVLDQAEGVGAGASGLPAGLAAPHVSPDDNVLSRITRAGVRSTLQRADALLQSGTDWALTGVLEHNLAGKRRLPKSDPGNSTSTSTNTNTNTNTGADLPHDMSTLASAAQIAAAGLPPETPALWHGQAAAAACHSDSPSRPGGLQPGRALPG